MVCHGPDPPENTPQEISSPSRPDLMMQGPQAEDSEDEVTDYINIGYQPLPQRPEQTASDHEHSDGSDTEMYDTDTNEDPEPAQVPAVDVPAIEPMATVLTRQVLSAPRPDDPIEMDTARAQQVMSAMANFSLPAAAIPEWARALSEEQWQQTLSDTIHKMKGNT